MSPTAVSSRLSGFSGELLTAEHPDYDRVRRVWNGSIDRRPAFITRCTSTADVAAAVRFGRRHDLPIAVRGGGHSIPGHSVCEGGLMIDLSPMKQIAVDPRRRTADVGPGVLWREFDAAAQRHGQATPGGEVSSTGVAGLTLGGGIGWLSRLHGLAADNLLGVDLVTADGDVVTVDDTVDAELMWGLRGGGGNFGVVTRFRFHLHPVGPVWGGMLFFPGDRAADVLTAAVEVGDGAPRELGLDAALVTAPPAPFIPAEQVGRPVVAVAAAFSGDPAVGREVVMPLRRLPRVLADTVGPTSYTAVQRWFDDANPPGRPTYLKCDFLRGLDERAIGILARNGTTPSSPSCQLLIRWLGGRVREIAPEATAFAARDADCMLTLVASWEGPDEDPAPHRTWVRGAWEGVRPWACGTYVNHLGDEGAGRVGEAYPPATWQRLAVLKARMDPGNVFALNQNVAPVPAQG
jgi:FAD binding domain